MLSDEQMAELRRLLDAATPGSELSMLQDQWIERRAADGAKYTLVEVPEEHEPDQEFIWFMYQHASRLLSSNYDAVRLRAAVRKLRRSDLPEREQPLWDELQAALRPAGQGGA